MAELLPGNLTSISGQRCRSCGSPLHYEFIDLGLSPISNAFVHPEDATRPEVFYPLRSFVCEKCKLVQLLDLVAPTEHFHANYSYFSSFSSSWLDHARRYAEMTISRFALNQTSRVVEIASNDGYLLQHFVNRGIPCFGIDPAANCAQAAEQVGVKTEIGFFGHALANRLAMENRRADLMIANNVLAHVPDLNDFVAGFKILLKDDGVATFEFPHLGALIAGNQFDTIYHEHYSYLSLLSVEPLLERHGLRVFDIEHLDTHGGSLRLYVAHEGAAHTEQEAVRLARATEINAGLGQLETYAKFRRQVEATKRNLLGLLIDLKNAGKRIAGYGAPAKGNTLLNYCGIRGDIVDFTVDRNPAKQGTLLPGTRIPVLAPTAIHDYRPDYVLILPWNLQDEILKDLAYIRDWGGKYVVPIPFPVIL